MAEMNKGNVLEGREREVGPMFRYKVRRLRRRVVRVAIGRGRSQDGCVR